MTLLRISILFLLLNIVWLFRMQTIIFSQDSSSSQQQGSFDLIDESEEIPYNTFLITPTPIFFDPEQCSPKTDELDPTFLLDNNLYGWTSNGIWYYIPSKPTLDAIVNADLPLILTSLAQMKADDGIPTPTPTQALRTVIETNAGSQQQGIIMFETPTPYPLPTAEQTIEAARARRVQSIVRDLQKTRFTCPVRISGY